MLLPRKFLLLLPVLVLPLVGCAAVFNNRFTAEETESQTFNVKNTPHIVVETFNGAIDVTIGKEGAVGVLVTKTTGGPSQEEADNDLGNIEVTMSRDGDTVRVEAKEIDKKMIGSRSARVELKVPRGSVLDLRTSNGKVASTGAIGDVNAHTSNGSITVKGGRGKLDLNTSNGAIDADGGADSLILKTSNGAITARGEDARIVAETSNGAIRFTGSLGAGKNEFTTSNGPITLKLPADAEFHIDAETDNGKITNEFDMPSTKSRRKSSIHGNVGDNPKVFIKMHSNNSSIQILKDKK